MKRTNALLMIAAALVPGAANASAALTFSGLANQIVTLLNSATFTLIALALVVYFWNVASGIYKASHGDATEQTALRSYLYLGVGIIFVMVSIWGIVKLLQTSLFGDGISNTTTSGAQVGCDSFGNCN